MDRQGASIWLGDAFPPRVFRHSAVARQPLYTMNFPYKLLATTVVAVPVLLGGRSGNASQAAPPKQGAVVTKPTPPTPIQRKSKELGGPTWQEKWTKIVEKAIPTKMLSRQVPEDVRRFCPRFYRMDKPDKRQFWAYFFQALAGAESGLNKVANVRHRQPSVDVRDSVTGRLTHQEGLLQLSYKDSDRYDCEFDWEADKRLPSHDPQKTILQPANNLRCGMKILYNQIITFHRPILYHASYWGTLRPGTRGNANFLKQMSNVPEACTEAPDDSPPARQTAEGGSGLGPSSVGAGN